MPDAGPDRFAQRSSCWLFRDPPASSTPQGPHRILLAPSAVSVDDDVAATRSLRLYGAVCALVSEVNNPSAARKLILDNFCWRCIIK
jgi:hypothetical protein